MEAQKQLDKPLKETAPTFNFDYEKIYRLRRHKGGSFNGLWELAEMENTRKAGFKIKKMIANADGLVYCLENIQGELEADGF